MPGMNGLEAIRELRSRDGELPIYAVTASVAGEDPSPSLEAGANGFISKPYRDVSIFDAIEEGLGVEYEYEKLAKDEPGEAAPQEMPSVTREMLRDLTDDLKRAMRESIAEADLFALHDHIDVVGERDPELAEGLRTLADGFEYERLTDLLA